MPPTSTQLRLALVDDHGLFREGLGRLLEAEPHLSLAGTYDSVASALPHLRHSAIDILLLDYDLGERNGLEDLALLRSAGFTGKILMVTAGMRESEILGALHNNVSGIFLKHSPPAELVTAIERIAAGEVWLDPKISQPMGAAAQRREAQPAPPALNERERAVLLGVFEGLSNKEIAARLSISESYVKALLQQLFEKSGVRTRAQLVRVALETGIATEIAAEGARNRAPEA